MDLDSVADELYSVAPEDFTGLRTERAAAARKAGDRALAKEITQLRRPTRSAWLVNLLARQSASEVQALLDLGDALRDAQQNLSGPDLRRLSAERHRVVDALARQAVDLGGAAGHTATDATRQEVAQTLQAALADPAAAEVVRAGRVVQSISYGGFGTPDLGPVTVPQQAKEPKAAVPTGDPAPAEQDASVEHRQSRRHAEQALAAAEKALEAAEGAVESAAAAATDAAEAMDRAEERVIRLREELAEAEDEHRESTQRATEAQQRLDRARSDASAARAAAGEAVARLEQVGIA